VNAITHLIEGWWWLIFIFGGSVSGSVRTAFRHRHRRRLAVLAAKAELEQAKNAARHPPEPQPVCGCTHHLSFHSPATGICAVDDCRCQQYIGPEPLGHVMALPLVDPELLSSPPQPTAGPGEVTGPA
jgi:hypothetical protein